jgi:hypothetical protein
MGYDVNITRAHHWAENAGHEIRPEEWRAIVAADPELEMRGVAEAGGLRYENPLLAIWTAHPDHEEVWADYSSGNLAVKNPDLHVLRKLCALAAQLGARVQGDEGEIYEADGRIVMDDDHVSGPGEARWDQEVTAASSVAIPSEKRRTPWWKRLFGGSRLTFV